jgi:sulfotransferase
MERLIQKNALLVPKMFGHEVGSVYNRVDAMLKHGFLGPALNALRQAWFSDHAGRLIAVQYESLCEFPEKVIAALYQALGEEPFTHAFDSVEYDEPEFDARLGVPGLHRVRPRVQLERRETILPPELFNQHNRNFWELLGQNPRGVPIL